MVERTCAKCSTVLRLDEKYRGKTIACPKCKNVIEAPDREKESAPKQAAQPEKPQGQKTEQAMNPNVLIAVVGTGIGVVVILLVVLILVFSLRSDAPKPDNGGATGTGANIVEEQEGESARKCKAKLIAIYAALEKYREENNTLPESLALLVDQGYLPDREATVCNDIPYAYRRDSFLYNNLGIEPSELLVAADDVASHDDQRQALFRDGRVELISDREYGRIQRELATAVREVQQKEAAAKKKAEREKAAAKVYEKFRAAGPEEIDAALADLKKLRTEFVETDVYLNHKEEIDTGYHKLQFKSRLFAIHRFIEDAKFAEARDEFGKLKTEFPTRSAEISEELSTLDAYEAALKLRAESKLTEARDALVLLMKKPGTAWKRQAQLQIQEIDAYVLRAAKLFGDARNAEAKGNSALAFMTYFRICREYPASAQRDAAVEARDKLIETMSYGPRFKDKAQFFKDEEKKKGFPKAIADGLEWLSKHQNEKDGRWDADAFGGSDSPNPGDPGLDIAATSAALLAFLGEGSTPATGEYSEFVAAGIKFLLGTQGDDGIFGDAKSPHATLNQVMATLALAEAANMTGDAEIIEAVKKAAKKNIALQLSGMGWADGPIDGSKKEDSTVLTAWMTIALASAKNLGIDVHAGATMAGARNWFTECTDRETGLVGKVPVAKAKPQPPGPELVPLETAAATLALFYIAGTGQEVNSDVIDKSLEVLYKEAPAWDGRKVNFCYWYFGLMALAQEQLPQYRSWRWALGLELVKNQVAQGPHAGSWPDPVKQRDFVGGRVWSTAMSLLILQNPYHWPGGKLHPRIKKKSGKTVTLVLDDDSYISGELVEESAESVTLRITRGKSAAEQKYERKKIKNILPGVVEKPK